jgi:ATP phosphoribosyltransferase-like protein
MRAAGLHAIETILSSEAVMIRSNKPDAAHTELIDRITSRVAGVVAAGKYVLCNYNIARSNVAQATQITPGRRAPTVSPLDDPEWVAVSSMVLKAELADVMDRLQVRLPPTPLAVRPRLTRSRTTGDRRHRRLGSRPHELPCLILPLPPSPIPLK